MTRTRFIVLAHVLALSMMLTTAACGREGVAQAPRPQSEILSRAALAGNVPNIDVSGVSFSTSSPVDLATGRAVFEPGASTGWHVHPGPGLVQVKTGSLTMFRQDCSKETFRAGQAFVDRPNELLLARNDGEEDLIIYFTFVLPLRAEVSTPRPSPTKCPQM